MSDSNDSEPTLSNSRLPPPASRLPRIEALEVMVQARLGYFDADGHCLKTTLEEPVPLHWPHEENLARYLAERVRLREEQLGAAAGAKKTVGGGDG